MRYGKECVCGRGGECQGVSAAFALMNDPRRGYVQLPPYTDTPENYGQQDMNAMRNAYLRNLNRTEESLMDSNLRRFVALHHFHPIVVQKHSEMPNAISPIPKTLKKVDLRYLKMNVNEEDRVRNEEGRKRKVYYFVPCYPIDQSKEDLKRLIRVNRLYTEARKPDGAADNVAAAAAVPAAATAAVAAAKPAPKPTTNITPLQPPRSKPVPNYPAPITPTGLSSRPKVDAKPLAERPSGHSPMVLGAKGTTQHEEEEAAKEILKAEEEQEAVYEFEGTLVPVGTRVFELEFTGGAIPDNVTMESDEGRRFLFKRMQKFEALRKETCTQQVQDICIRWRASLEVMQGGIFEIARAERLIRGAALANQAYAEAMQAIYDDGFLDEENITVLDPRKQKKLQKERSTLVYSIDALNMTTNASPEKGRREESHTQSLMLASIVDAQALVADKFTENYDKVNDEVVEELYNLRQTLKTQMIEFKRIGDIYIRDLKDSDAEVVTSFASYEVVGSSPGNFHGRNPAFHMNSARVTSASSPTSHGVAAGSFHGGPPEVDASSQDGEETKKGLFGRISKRESKAKSDGGGIGGSKHGSRLGSRHGSRHGGSNDGSRHGTDADEDDRETPSDNGIDPPMVVPSLFGAPGSPIGSALYSNSFVRDGWLIELIYRQAVNRQVLMLQKLLPALQDIWKAMQIVETNRQLRLQEVLLDFMPRQRRLFLGLTPIPGPILEDLVALRLEPQELEDQIESSVRKRSEKNLRVTNAARSSIMNRSRTQAPNLEELHGVLTGEFFDNGLLRAARLVERKTGVRGIWKMNLLVVTSDNYMHMFDVSAYPDVTIQTQPEAVYELLLPDYDIPSLESDHVMPREEPILGKLTPTATANLYKCSTITFSRDARILEISEALPLSPGTFRTSSTRKYVIKVADAEEAKHWMTLLKSLEEDANDGDSPGHKSRNKSPKRETKETAPAQAKVSSS